MADHAARFFDLFLPGTHDRIALFGPESARSVAFCNRAAVAPESVFWISTDTELARLDNGIPLVLLPKWWQSGASAALISDARSTQRQILIAFP